MRSPQLGSNSSENKNKTWVQLTARALAAAQNLEQTSPEYKGLSLRLYIDGKGCDGFYYGVTFDSPSQDDHTLHQGGLQLVIDPVSLEFMEGSTVDWIDDERGRGFLVENPAHRRYRGKFYKKKAWQDRLKKQEP